jgi:hypothetical protein
LKKDLDVSHLVNCDKDFAGLGKLNFLQGKNGSGKSFFLNLLAIDLQSKGYIYSPFNGDLLSPPRQNRRDKKSEEIRKTKEFLSENDFFVLRLLIDEHLDYSKMDLKVSCGKSPALSSIQFRFSGENYHLSSGQAKAINALISINLLNKGQVYIPAGMSLLCRETFKSFCHLAKTILNRKEAHVIIETSGDNVFNVLRRVDNSFDLDDCYSLGGIPFSVFDFNRSAFGYSMSVLATNVESQDKVCQIV